MKNFKSFETDRLLLKPTSPEDAEMLFELLNSPKWIEFIGDRNVKSVEEAKEYIVEKMLPQLEKFGFSNYTVIRKLDHIKMGICGLYDRPGLDGIDLGFAFLPTFEKQGYAYEAANKIIEAGFNYFEIQTMNAITNKNNIDAQILLEKLGFQLTGTAILENGTEQLYLYKIENNK